MLAFSEKDQGHQDRYEIDPNRVESIKKLFDMKKLERLGEGRVTRYRMIN